MKQLKRLIFVLINCNEQITKLNNYRFDYEHCCTNYIVSLNICKKKILLEEQNSQKLIMFT